MSRCIRRDYVLPHAIILQEICVSSRNTTALLTKKKISNIYIGAFVETRCSTGWRRII